MQLLETMNIICNIEFFKVNIIYKNILKLILLFQTLQQIAQRPIASIYEKPKKYLLIKVHEEWKPMAICVHNPAHESKSKQKTPAGGKGEQPLFIPNQKRATKDSYKGTKPLRMD